MPTPYYKSSIHQLISLRLGLIHEDNLYGKKSIFLAMGSQTSDAKRRVEYYKQMHTNKEANIVILPFDFAGTEPGDNYEIYTYYENVLGIDFYVTEKLHNSHPFFKDFGEPTNDLTEYHFNTENIFTGRRTGRL